MIPRPVCPLACLPRATMTHGDCPSVDGICCDSRQIRPGFAFVAIRGIQGDGHAFVRQAASGGAAVVVVEHPQEMLTIPQCVVPSTREAWSLLAMAGYGNPQQKLTMAGITGTNGKTTTAWLLRSILTAADHQTGLLGTIEHHDGYESHHACLTTPESVRQAELMTSMIKRGTTHCIMEISSHALAQQRCSAVPLAAALITNITHDHLDYHESESAYRAAKAQIAGLLHCDAPLLLNGDDEGVRQLLRQAECDYRRILFGTSDDCELRVKTLRQTHRSQRLKIFLAQGDAVVRVRLTGRHNASNCLAAAGMAEQLGISLAKIVRGLETTLSIPGRMERIDEGQPFDVVVDYAHTPDAVWNVLSTLRPHVHGRLICVFGAGGDRDRDKRPEMARAASAADHIIITSDNPRSESPARIIDDILQGFPPSRALDVDIDRRVAIRRGLEMAQPGDAVVIAGRGHESFQIIGENRISFDDRAVTRELLRELHLENLAGSRSVSGESIPRGIRSSTQRGTGHVLTTLLAGRMARSAESN